MSGRRPLSRVFVKRCERLGCGHVFGLLTRKWIAPLALMRIRFGSLPHQICALLSAPVRIRASEPHIIAIGRLRTDQRTKDYVARRIAEGHSKLDAIRALKRYLAREVFTLITQRRREINATRIAA